MRVFAEITITLPLPVSVEASEEDKDNALRDALGLLDDVQYADDFRIVAVRAER